MRQWAILGAVVLGVLLVAGGLWYRAEVAGRSFARHSADGVVAAMRAEGIAITDVAVTPPTAEYGYDTETRRLAVAGPDGPRLVVVVAFALAGDRDRFVATLRDPQVAAVVRTCSRDNVIVVISPGVPESFAARCAAALQHLP